MAELWWREKWKEAIYRSDLRPNARLVALIHADFARDKRTSWVHLDDLMHRTGMSRSQALSWRGEVIKAGFLVVLQKSSPGRSPVFGLVIPEGNGSEIPDVNGSEIPDLSEATGPEIDPNGSEIPDERVRDSGPHQSLINHSSISLSPEEELVAELLGLDRGDERLRLVEGILEYHEVRSPKPWLRKCHANGELLDLLDSIQADLDADPEFNVWGSKSCNSCGFLEGAHSLTCRHRDDGLMPNPGYIDGWGMPERIRPEDHYRPRMRNELGMTDPLISQYIDAANGIHTDGPAAVVWAEAWMTARHDADSGLLAALIRDTA